MRILLIIIGTAFLNQSNVMEYMILKNFNKIKLANKKFEIKIKFSFILFKFYSCFFLYMVLIYF